MDNQITFYLDNHPVDAQPGQMVIQAASEAGLYIPYLCYHPGMKPYGACRMCVVEVEGLPGTHASCTLPVRDGMHITTSTNSILKVRDTILDLLLSEHPHGCLTCHRVDLCGPQDICLRHVNVTDRCVTCPKNERCELKDTTRYHTQGLNSVLTYEYRDLQIDIGDPFYDRDYNLCIVCSRCVRACDEIRGDLALAMTERSGQVLVGTSMGDSLLEAGCEFCGACIDVCPVGALTESDYKWERPARIEQSVCSNCPVGCQMTYEVNEWERVIRVIPELNAPANMGQACFKGKFGFKYVNDKRRIRTPLVKTENGLVKASWEEAFHESEQTLQSFQSDEFAILVSPRATNEDLYMAQKFSRVVMKSNSIDSPGNIRPGILQGIHEVLGCYSGTNPIADLAISKTVLLVGSNVTEEQNVLAIPVKQAVRSGHQKLIVIDSREVEMTRYSTLWLRPYPGTDSILIAGLLRSVLDQGLIDQQFITQFTVGIDDLISSVDSVSVEDIAFETGVSTQQIHEAATLFAENGPASVIYALETLETEFQAEAAKRLTMLSVITGNLGKPGAGLYPLTTGANDQGTWDMGCLPSFLPGQQLLSNDAERKRVEGIWGVEIPSSPGLSVLEIANAIRQNRLKALIILGDHDGYYDGSLGEIVELAKDLEFLMVTDAFKSPIAEQANVVFPSSTFLESYGTYTNLERRVQPLRKVFTHPQVEGQSVYKIISELGRRMDKNSVWPEDPQSIMYEISKVNPGYGGVSYQRLLDEAIPTRRPSSDNPLPTQVQYSQIVPQGLMLPCYESNDPGSTRLFESALNKPHIKLWAIQSSDIRISAPQDFPFLLAHGRVLAQPTHPMEVVRGGGLNHIERDEYFLMNPEDVNHLGLDEGARIRIYTIGRRFELEGVVRVWEEGFSGVINLTTLFGEMASSLEKSDHPDPMGHVPKLGIKQVQVEMV